MDCITVFKLALEKSQGDVM